MDNLVHIATFSRHSDFFLSWNLITAILVTHVAVSIFMAGMAWFVIKPKEKQARPYSVLFFLLMMLLFLPLLGIVLVASIVILYRYFQIKKDVTPFGTSESVIFESTAKGATKQSIASIGGLQHKIANSEVESASRFQALNTLRTMPLKISVPLLKQILSDKTEDIRLYAYGMLDKQEKNINNEIHRILAALKNNPLPDNKPLLYKNLCENYWNLVYYQLLQGDLMVYALNQAADAIEEAIKLKDDDADFWTLRGKIYMKLHKYEEAKFSFNRLSSFGLGETKLAPYLAEIAFMEKNYDEVRRMLKQSSSFTAIPSLEPLIEYWTGRR